MTTTTIEVASREGGRVPLTPQQLDDLQRRIEGRAVPRYGATLFSLG